MTWKRSQSESGVGRHVLFAGVCAVAAASAVSLAAASSASSDKTQPLSSRPLPPIATAAGATSISGMTQILDGSSPLNLTKGTSIPGYTSLGAVGGLAQAWVDSGAVKAYGPPRDGEHGLQLPIPLAFARQHPGPCEAFVRVLQFGSHNDAVAALHEPELTGSYSPGYADIASGGVNGGTVGSVQSLANDGLDEYRFHWLSGNVWVEVNVLGYGLTLEQGQQIAIQVQPHA